MPSKSTQVVINDRIFLGWIFYCVCIPHLLYLFLCWIFRLLPCPGYCKSCCKEYWGACVLLNYGFLWVYAQRKLILKNWKIKGKRKKENICLTLFKEIRKLGGNGWISEKNNVMKVTSKLICTFSMSNSRNNTDTCQRATLFNPKEGVC